jgi:hypothetical protein
LQYATAALRRIKKQTKIYLRRQQQTARKNAGTRLDVPHPAGDGAAGPALRHKSFKMPCKSSISGPFEF